MIKSKKAEMTTKQIVILIVLITSFAIILFFLFRLNLGEESDKQLCYNSVMNRANKMVPTDTVALNCKRSYVCITKKDDCGLIDPVKIKVKTKEDVYEALANQLSDCWWMFGQGKVKYAGKDLAPSLYCSLCSQITFDNSVQDIFGGKTFDSKEFYQYMSKNKVDSQSSQTYNEYLYNTNDLSLISGGQNYKKIDLESEYYSLMGVFSEVDTITWVGIGVAAGTVGLILAPISIGLVGALVIGGGAGGTATYFLAPVLEGLSGQQFIPPSLIKVNSQEFTNLSCSEITTFS